MANSLILKQLIDELGITVNAFEKALGVGASAINKAIGRDSAIKKDTIDKIVKTYPKVRREWLITGEGEMFATHNNNPDITNVKIHNSDYVNDSITSQDTKKKEDDMITRLLDLLERRMKKDDEKWDRLLDAHNRLINKFPDERSGESGTAAAK